MSDDKIDLGNIGEIEVPEPEVLDEPWRFRAACHLKDPDASAGVLVFGLILDLGFHTYRQISCLLDGYLVRQGVADLVVEFASNWAENGTPNPLEAVTLKRNGDLWHVTLSRAELDIETLKVLGRVTLGEALEEQGLVMKIAETEPDA